MVAVRRVLVVDYDDAIREVAEVALGIVGGWDVVAASSGAECVRRAGEVAPEAILLDVMMPGMDGPTTVERLREDPATATIPVILLTAQVQPSELRAWERLDLAGVIAKPFDPMTLASKVAALLGWDR
jgi:CheY-like chemotaxis protein